MERFSTDTEEFRTLVLLSAFFTAVALLLYFVPLGQISWDILATSAIAWFVIKANDNQKRLWNALKIGAFLLIFDFVLENAGWFLGLWHPISTLAVGAVPIQVMSIALFGGAGWALYLPRKFNRWHTLADSFVFALFGALGEWLLIRQGVFTYMLWWTSTLAFVSYFATWLILHFLRYRAFGDRN